MIRPPGLRARLAGWTALVMALTAGVPGSLLTWRAYRALSADASESQLELAHSLASELDDEFSQAISAVEAVASRLAVLRSRGALIPRLALVASANQQLDDLLVTDLNGALLGRAPGEEAPPDFSRADRRELARLAEADRSQTVSLLHADGSGRLILRLAHAMGRRAAALGQIRLDSQGIGIGDVGTLRLGTTGFAYLVDGTGQPLLLPSLLGRLAGRDPGSLAFRFRGAPFVRVVPGPGGGDLLAVAPLQSVGWGVAVRRSLAEAEAPSRRMRRELIAFVLAALVVGTGLALALARPLVNRILELAAAARRIEAGHLDMALPAPGSGDEIAEVSGALVHLAGALKEQQAARERAHARALEAEKRAAQNERLASLGQLAAGLAHELNNPLMVIHGAAGEAEAADGVEGARPWLERVRRESERCSRLVRELLDYARPRPPSPRPFDMAELARESFEAARTGRPAPYRLKLAAARPRVVADPDQFQQVLLNLFGNAMDAMPEGGDVEVRLAAEDDGWRLNVRDNGPGVPEGSWETIFRPFFTSKPKGTGLGLAIARSMLLGHGGTLRCVGVRGPGACFEARWPAPEKGASDGG